jgi:ABC-type nitrate/sulfonate/bicarbonate transport system permease component
MKLDATAQERLIAVLSPIGVLVIWQILSDTGVISARYVPSPLRIVEAAMALSASGELWQHVSASLYRLSVGFVLGGIPGIIIGILMGLNRYLRAALDPLIAATYPIPKIAVLPLLMLVFGIGDGSKIAVVAFSVLLLTIINTIVGVRGIDRVHFDVARNYNTPWHKLFWRVIVPGSLPTIFAGLRISLGISLIVLVGAEFVASRAGIGFLIWSSWETLLVENMFVGIIVITILGVVSAFLLRECERYFIPWQND